MLIIDLIRVHVYVCLRTLANLCVRFYVYTRRTRGDTGNTSGRYSRCFCASVPRRCATATEEDERRKGDSLFQRRNVICRYPINVAFRHDNVRTIERRWLRLFRLSSPLEHRAFPLKGLFLKMLKRLFLIEDLQR